MEFKQVLETRTSVRHFVNEAVPSDILHEIVKAGTLAPSINNSQPWRFIAISNKEKLRELGKIVESKIEFLLQLSEDKKSLKVKNTVEKFATVFVDAPLIVAVLIKPYSAVIDAVLEENELDHQIVDKMRNHPNLQSLGACIENMLLKAVDLGYSGCWLTGLLLARPEIEKALGVEEPYTLGACVAFGKSDEPEKHRTHLTVEEVLTEIK